MALDNDQLAVLKTELDTDPMTLGYAGTSHPEAAALLNTVGLSGETIPNASVPIHAVRDVIGSQKDGATFAGIAEWEALSQGKRDLIMLIFSNGDTSIDITNTDVVNQILGVFTVGDAPVTRAALIALGTRSATRAEILFGANINVTAADVAEARQLP